MSTSQTRELVGSVADWGHHTKPVDLGTGHLSASVKPDARLCSINGFYPKHDFITLSPMEPFPNGKWYDDNPWSLGTLLPPKLKALERALATAVGLD